MQEQAHAKVADAVTDAGGKAVIGDLPLGTYRIEETKAPEGFARNTEPQIVTFSYQDQDTPVISQQATFTNDRQKVSLTVEKQDAETNAVVAGAVFALYNKANILCAQHEYKDAINYYTQAISIDNDFAEAYFNRGLTYIFTGENEKGLSDLSKAGELGMYQAYNMITRFK